MSYTDVPIALLEPTDIPSQNKQNIKGRQGRNISSTKITCSRTMIWSDKVRRFQFQKQTRGTVKKIHCHQYFIQVRYTVNVNDIDACEVYVNTSQLIFFIMGQYRRIFNKHDSIKYCEKTSYGDHICNTLYLWAVRSYVGSSWRPEDPAQLPVQTMPIPLMGQTHN